MTAATQPAQASPAKNAPGPVRLVAATTHPHKADPMMFDDLNGWRHTVFITNRPGGDIATLEMQHRQRDKAESVIRDFKACGGSNLPFDCIVNNTTWVTLAAAVNLMSWARHLTLHDTDLAKATPKTLRYRLLHTAGQTSPAGRVPHLDQRQQCSASDSWRLNTAGYELMVGLSSG